MKREKLGSKLGFHLRSGFTSLGEGSNVLDLEDFLVSNLILPAMILFIFVKGIIDKF